MKKIITLIILSLVLISCWDEIQGNEIINNEKINTEVEQENVNTETNTEITTPENLDDEIIRWPAWNWWWPRWRFRE